MILPHPLASAVTTKERPQATARAVSQLLLLSVALSSGLDGPMSDPGSKIRAQVEGDDAPVCGWLVDHLRSLPLHSLRSLSLSLQGTGTVSTSIRLPLSWVRPGVPSEQRRGECLGAAAENSGTVAHDSKPWVCVRTDIRGGAGVGRASRGCVCLASVKAISWFDELAT